MLIWCSDNVPVNSKWLSDFEIPRNQVWQVGKGKIQVKFVSVEPLFSGFVYFLSEFVATEGQKQPLNLPQTTNAPVSKQNGRILKICFFGWWLFRIHLPERACIIAGLDGGLEFRRSDNCRCLKRVFNLTGEFLIGRLCSFDVICDSWVELFWLLKALCFLDLWNWLCLFFQLLDLMRSNWPYIHDHRLRSHLFCRWTNWDFWNSWGLDRWLLSKLVEWFDIDIFWIARPFRRQQHWNSLWTLVVSSHLRKRIHILEHPFDVSPSRILMWIKQPKIPKYNIQNKIHIRESA